MITLEGNDIVAHVIGRRVVAVVAAIFKQVAAHLYPIGSRDVDRAVTRAAEDVVEDPDILMHAGLVQLVGVGIMRAEDRDGTAVLA